jgi:hypothetical protein
LQKLLDGLHTSSIAGAQESLKYDTTERVVVRVLLESIGYLLVVLAKQRP